jgi:hypothetical protein
MRELDKFIAASDERIQKKQHFDLQQSPREKEDTNKKSAEVSMAGASRRRLRRNCWPF